MSASSDIEQKTILRGAPNNVATEVAPCTPWTFQANVPEHLGGDKQAYKKWRALPDTNHLVFTGWEAVNPAIRINKETNSARRVHAIVCDFDALIGEDEYNSILDRCPADLRPTWIARTYSNGARVVWMFEAPLGIGS